MSSADSSGIVSRHPHNGSDSGESATRLLARLDVIVSLIVVGLIFLLVGEARWANGESVHEAIEWIGLLLIVVSIFGRTWCAIYLGNEERQALMVQGPYSMSRNPHFSFTILGAVGIGAQVGSVMAALICGALVWVVLQRVVLQEEEQLSARHGAGYSRYRESVPRFVPNFSLWRDVEMIKVWPHTVAITFLESVVFLLAIPLAEGIEYLHDIQALPILVRLTVSSCRC